MIQWIDFVSGDKISDSILSHKSFGGRIRRKLKSELIILCILVAKKCS